MASIRVPSYYTFRHLLSIRKSFNEKTRLPNVILPSISYWYNNSISGYKLRQVKGKQEAVKALQSLNFKVVAAGDSYNDIGMLKQADMGILFDPPKNVIDDYPQFPVSNSYEDFKNKLRDCKSSLEI